MDLMGKEVVAGKFIPRRWNRLEDGSLLLQENELVGAWQQMDNRWVLVRDGVTTERNFRIRLYSAQELLQLLQSVGFTRCEAYGSLQGIPYDHEAQRLVVLARK
jgi:hypothetical protein